MPIQTKVKFSEKILRNLGHPVIKINVTDEQIDDVIEDAMEFLTDHHRDFYKIIYYVATTTQDDIDRGYFILPDNVTNVVEFMEKTGYGMTAGSDTGGFGTQAFHMQRDYNLNYQQSGMNLGWQMVQWEIFKTFNETVLRQYEGEGYELFSYERFNRRLTPTSTMVLDRIVGVEAYERLITPESNTSNLYANIQFQKLATAYLKRKWGEILKKFVGVNMPGGITLNGEAIFTEAIEEIEKLEDVIDRENEMWGLHIYIS